MRHLHCTYDKLCLTDKVLHGYSLGKERIEDVMEMVRIASGLSHEAFDASPHMFTNINSSLQCPSKVPVLTVLEPQNVAISIRYMFDNGN